MRKLYKSGILLIVSIILFVSYNIIARNQEVYALSKYGSRGDEVKQIQTKLKNWGYYKGSVDGIYGSGTLAAVKSFQKRIDYQQTVLQELKHCKLWEYLIQVIVQAHLVIQVI